MTLTKSHLTYILTIEPSWNNIFQQSFDPDIHAEKCFKTTMSICPSNIHAFYLTFNRRLEIK